MMKAVLFCLALLPSALAFAAPHIVYVGGAPHVDFDDGRKAVISNAIGKVNHGAIGLRQIENTCDPGQILANCKIKMDFASHTISLRWADHPDKTKIGAIVKQRYGTGDSNVYEIKDGFGLYTWFATLTGNTWGQVFNPDVLECDQYDWVKYIPSNNGHLLLQSWTGEGMVSNPETGVNENTTNSGGFNIELQKNAANSFTFVKVGAAVGGFGTPPYISDSVSTITFTGNNNQQCQVAFEVNLQDLIKQVQAPHFYDPDPATEAPLTNAKDLNRAFSVNSNVELILTPGSNLGTFE